MTRTQYNKLIRDLIPEIIAADNCTAKISELSGAQFSLALKQKVVEEAMELLKAETRDDILSEISDIQELIDTILSDKNIPKEELIISQDNKKNKRGSFDKKLFLEYIDSPDK